jgi:uncharacterized membrane protein
MSRRVLPALLGLILVALIVTTLVTGQALYTVPAIVLVGIIGVMALGEWRLKKRVETRAGDPQSDNADPVPSTHLAKDEETPLGDTTEAHDEISPHDLPKDHPGRQAAEAQGVTEGTR